MKVLIILSMLALGSGCAHFAESQPTSLGNTIRQERTDCIRRLLGDNVGSKDSVQLCEWIFRRTGSYDE